MTNRATRTAPAQDTSQSAQRNTLVDQLLTPIAAITKAPLASFHTVWGVAGLLSFIGLVMVLSASNVSAVAEGGNPFDIFLRQALFVTLGWVGFFAALRVNFSVVRLGSPWLLLASIGLLIAVLIPGVGSKVNGSRGWLDLGLFSVQPAEVAKFALILWACAIVSTRMRTGYWRDMLLPAGFGYIVVVALILAEPDLGMATATTMVFLCVLWFAGYPLRHFAWVVGIGVSAFAIMTVTMAYRFDRVRTFVNTFVGDFSNPQGDAYQSYQAMLSLADGGLFGKGLGQSSAKWFWLPEITNDFIFAIIGEELGWFGAIFVVSIYLVLGWAGIRVALRSVDPFRRLLAGAITCSIVLQACINIGYVVGLLPVTGLQLPLISNGGTSAVVTLTALGLLANCARHEPEAISAILSAPSKKRRRFIALPDPVPYTPDRVLPPSNIPGRSSAGRGVRRYGEPVVHPGQSDRTTPARRRPTRGREDRQPVPASRTARTTTPANASYPPAGRTARATPRRGATPMTGRNARPVRERERARIERERQRDARETADAVTRPTPIHRGRDRR